MEEGRLERERRSRKYGRIYIFFLLTTIVLIIGSIVAVTYTGVEYITYLVLAIIIGMGITNDIQKRYKKNLDKKGL
ncbi:TPA: hypothetical protein QCU33_005819 [Bacillus cereus]|nr:hypothetical protein [Bacillus cereus]